MVYYHRNGRSLAFYLTKPIAMCPDETRRRTWKRNPVLVALKLQEQLEALPEQTHGELAKQVGISRGRVCQYLRLLALPSVVVSFMADPANEEIAKTVSEDALRRLLNLPVDTDAHQAFLSLLPK